MMQSLTCSVTRQSLVTSDTAILFLLISRLCTLLFSFRVSAPCSSRSVSPHLAILVPCFCTLLFSFRVSAPCYSRSVFPHIVLLVPCLRTLLFSFRVSTHRSPRSVALPRNARLLFLANLIHEAEPDLFRYEAEPRNE